VPTGGRGPWNYPAPSGECNLPSGCQSSQVEEQWLWYTLVIHHLQRRVVVKSASVIHDRVSIIAAELLGGGEAQKPRGSGDGNNQR